MNHPLNSRSPGSGAKSVSSILSPSLSRIMPVHIYGYPRSGNHFLAAALALNFFHLKRWDSLFTPNVHQLPPSKKPPGKLIWITRAFSETAYSLFALRARFGLDVPDMTVFLRTEYRNMWNPAAAGSVEFRGLDYTEPVSAKDPLFSRVSMYPLDHWNRYTNAWEHFCTNFDNVLKVDHFSLCVNYHATLNLVATFLGFPNQETFHLVPHRVGWCPPGYGRKFIPKKRS